MGPTTLFDNPEMEEILSQAKTSEERVKIIKNLPLEKIFDIVKETIQGKILSENLSSVIQTRLNVSKEIAEKLSEELEKKVLILAQESSKEKEIPKKPTVKVPEVEPSLEKPPQKDIYREPIE